MMSSFTSATQFISFTTQTDSAVSMRSPCGITDQMQRNFLQSESRETGNLKRVASLMAIESSATPARSSQQHEKRLKVHQTTGKSSQATRRRYASNVFSLGAARSAPLCSGVDLVYACRFHCWIRRTIEIRCLEFSAVSQKLTNELYLRFRSSQYLLSGKVIGQVSL